MRVCICGGGALGHVCAGVFSLGDNVEVNILSGHPGLWNNDIEVIDLNGRKFNAHINKVSSNPEEVAANQDIILLCVPGYLIQRTLEQVFPYLGEAIVGSVVSSTGFFFIAHRILGEDAKLFGFQRVPFIARVNKYGESADLLGYKSNLAIAVENIYPVEAFVRCLEQLFLTPVSVLGSFLEVSLTNSNPILHTGRLYTMFLGNENRLFDHNILFYKEWTDEASQKLIKMDQEFFQLLNNLGLSSIPTLLDYYESTDAQSLTKKIRSIPAFQKILSPMKKVQGGWRVDFDSRYFTEDFPFGLRWIKELCDEKSIQVPNINQVFEWGMNGIRKFGQS